VQQDYASDVSARNCHGPSYQRFATTIRSWFIEAATATVLKRGTYRKHLKTLGQLMQYAFGSAVQMLEEYGRELFVKSAGGGFVLARVPMSATRPGWPEVTVHQA
jgi:DNA-binding transcriptional MocR family regulator